MPAAVLLLGLLVWGVVEGLRVRDGAQDVERSGRDLLSAVRAEEWSTAQNRGDELLLAARTMGQAASSPPLRFASVLPVVGDDVTSVRAVASSAKSVAEGAVLPLLDAFLRDGDPDDLVVEGRVDVDLLAELAPTAATAADVVAAEDARLDETLGRLGPHDLAGPVRERVEAAAARIDTARSVVQGVHASTQLLPPMLGSDSQREYVLVFQNLAEARPTGGIFGAWASVNVSDGRVELVRSGVNDDLGRPGNDQIEVDPSLRSVYGADVAISPNMNLSAHFPSAAMLLSQLWVARGGGPPDGVISVDPVMLAAVLGATGPVDVPGGPRLSRANAVQVLQSDIYSVFAGDEPGREAYLRASITAVFARLVGQASLRTFSAVAEPVAGGHLQVWSASADEQRLLEAAGISGALPAPAADTVGIFTTNTDGSKLDHFVTRRVQVGGGCGPAPHLTLDVENTAPVQVPPYVAAKVVRDGVALPPTTHELVVSAYLAGRGVAAVSVDGSPRAFSVDVERGWTLVRVTVQVPAATTTRFRIDFSGPEPPPDTVLLPPGLADPEVAADTCTSEP